MTKRSALLSFVVRGWPREVFRGGARSMFEERGVSAGSIMLRMQSIADNRSAMARVCVTADFGGPLRADAPRDPTETACARKRVARV